MKKILVTGADGFVGRHLCLRLAHRGWDVHAAVRVGRTYRELAAHATVHPMADITGSAQWAPLLADTEAVVHLAARVHVMRETTASAAAEYNHINTAGTAALARAALQSGATRFVFLSTVKIHGERTLSSPFAESAGPAPADPYSASKRDAERALAEIAAGTQLAVTILRPPLVYGPGVKGNFPRLLNLVRRRIPLPFASVNNSRSFLYIGNLVSAIEQTLSTPAAGTNAFLVSDDHDLSTPRLIRMIAAAMKIDARLLSCPLSILLALGRIAGKGGEMSRIVESLSIDCSRIKQQLHWTPPFTVEHGLEDTVRWFLDTRN